MTLLLRYLLGGENAWLFMLNFEAWRKDFLYIDEQSHYCAYIILYIYLSSKVYFINWQHMLTLHMVTF